MFFSHETARQELYPCNVPLCTKTLPSRVELEKHILTRHSGHKSEVSNSVVDFEFDFGTTCDSDDVKSEPIQPIVSKTKPIQPIIKSESLQPIVRKSEPIQPIVKTRN